MYVVSHKRNSLLLGALLLLAAAAGCGGGQPHAAPSAVKSANQRSSRPSSPAAPVKLAQQALNPATLVGKTLFGLDDSNAVCQTALDGTPPPRLPIPGGSGPGDNSAADTASATVVGTGTLVPGGLLVLTCAPSASATTSTLVAFDLFKRAVAWQLSLAGYDSYMFGTNHLFLISHDTTPPTGLKSSSTTYTLTAVSLRTGATSWTAPYFADSPNSGDNGISSLTEGPSGIPGHPQDVVVTYLGTSAYDAQTGANLWNISDEYDTEANGSYTLDGIVEIYGYQDNYYDSHITGFDARTNKKVWDLRLQAPCVADTGPEDDIFDGLVEWEFRSSCFQAHNVATGQLVADHTYPSSWQSVAATPTAILEYSHSKLSYFTMSDLNHPVWSESAGSTMPLAMSSGHVLVQAPSGMLVLSAANGSITSTVSSAFSGSGSYSVVDGLVVQGSEDSETSVLELDPPR